MEDVWLHVYDLSEGLASDISSCLFDFPLVNGIWHSSLVLYNKAFEYGPYGVRCVNVDDCALRVLRKYHLGKTQESLEILKDYMSFLNHTKFKGEYYNAFTFNCHVFTNFLANELVQRNIPDYLLELPKDCVASCLGLMYGFCLKKNIGSIMSLFVNKNNISW